MSYTDFIATLMELNGEVTEKMIEKAFNMISQGNVNITRQQLFDTIKNSEDGQSAKLFLKEMDKVIMKY